MPPRPRPLSRQRKPHARDAPAPLQVPGQAPAGVYGHSATVIGTNIVIFGGWDGITPMNSVNVLDTSLL